MYLSFPQLETSSWNPCPLKSEEASILSSLDPMVAEKALSSEFWVDFGPYLVESSKGRAYKSSFTFLKGLTCPQGLSEIRLSILTPSRIWAGKVKLTMTYEYYWSTSSSTILKIEKEALIPLTTGQMSFLEVKSNVSQWQGFSIIVPCLLFWMNAQAQWAWTFRLISIREQRNWT